MTDRELIEKALAGVKLVICPRCEGWGKIGLASFCCTCLDCKGRGLTTTNELEIARA
jgi:hypothetical protein